MIERRKEGSSCFMHLYVVLFIDWWEFTTVY